MIDATHTSMAEGQRWTGRIQIALVLGVLLIALALNRLLIASGDPVAVRSSESAVAPVQVTRPAAANERIEIRTTGVVQARSPVAIVPQVGGRVVEIAPQLAPGGRFEAGEILFRIDPVDFEVAVGRAEAELRSAEATRQLERAEADIARREWQLVHGEEPIPALVAREPQLAQADANVAAAESRLREARLALERTRFSLPFDGRVTAADIDLGQTLAANQSVGNTYADASVEVLLSLSASEAETLEPLIGRAVRINASGPGSDSAVTGRIVRVGARFDERTRLLDVAVQPDPRGALLPGQFLAATIEGDQQRDAFWLPVEALGRNDQAWIVRSDGQNAVLEGVQPRILLRESRRALAQVFDVGEGLVVTPPPQPASGLRVRIIEGAGSQADSNDSSDTSPEGTASGAMP